MDKAATTAPEPSAADAGVYVNGYAFQTCASSASPLPGWRSCQGTVKLIIKRALSSGYVSVFFNYPDSGGFYHGQLYVGSGVPGTVTVDGIDMIKSDPASSYAMVGKALKLDADTVSGMLSGLKLTPYADNAQFYGLTGGKAHYETLFDTAFVIWRKKGLVTRAVEAKVVRTANAGEDGVAGPHPTVGPRIQCHRRGVSIGAESLSDEFGCSRQPRAFLGADRVAVRLRRADARCLWLPRIRNQHPG